MVDNLYWLFQILIYMEQEPPMIFVIEMYKSEYFGLKKISYLNLKYRKTVIIM